MTPTTVRSIRILLVEDSPTDAELTLAAMKTAKMSNEVIHVQDGVQAMDFLRRRGAHSHAEQPDLILLDLNLPRKDGREVLAELKEDPDLKMIPVVVLTTSKAEEDIIRSYKLHANCYVTKPVNFERFLEIVQSIETFWLTVVSLPAKR
ncbi:MAG: response regulator [Candidatus Brocadiia bacterium]